MSKKKRSNRWIPKDLDENKVRNYLRRKYGSQAFNPDGTLKVSYIKKAIKETRDTSMKRALNLAITFKKMNKKRRK